MNDINRPRPVILCILDGWGHREKAEDNAITQASSPVYDRLMAECPWSLLDASETHVGLPSGQMGNSEVGHMNIGAGRVVLQDLPRIDHAIRSGKLAVNSTLQKFVDTLKKSGGTCHLMGLLSPGGVHSHQNHMVVLAKILASAGVPVAVHALLDGRDTPPKSAAEFVERFEDSIIAEEGIRIATICGRYYAMDRDQRWDRVEIAYNAFTKGQCARSVDAQSAIRDAYADGETDEFISPHLIGDYDGMHEGDGILMANFRTDRARELLTALLDPNFSEFVRDEVIRFSGAVGMVEYSDGLNTFLSALFTSISLRNTMGEIISSAGLKQLRIAETEKYAHVTFFFNGGQERVFPGEDRILIASPKVATYDLKPEMSAHEVTDKLVEAIHSNTFDFVLVNYANGDMVGHTGNFDAAVKAVEVVDTCLGRLEDAVKQVGGTLLITADHGNAERMSDWTTRQPHTAHTMDRVPAILVNAPTSIQGLLEGRLADITPTLLDIMGLAKPDDVSGKSLLIHWEDTSTDRLETGGRVLA
jgi:2,3-bisphosphoglycerate-independent phosphoglycerate mutase